MTLSQSLFPHSSRNNCIFDRTKHLEPHDSCGGSLRNKLLFGGWRCRKITNRIKLGSCCNKSVVTRTCGIFFSFFLQRKLICCYLWQAPQLQFILFHPASSYVQFDPLYTDMTVPIPAGHKTPPALAKNQQPHSAVMFSSPPDWLPASQVGCVCSNEILPPFHFLSLPSIPLNYDRFLESRLVFFLCFFPFKIDLAKEWSKNMTLALLSSASLQNYFWIFFLV